MGALKQITKNRRFPMLMAIIIATFGIIGYSSFAGNVSETKADAVISAARSKIDAEYSYGTEGDATFDSSGFVYWAFEKKNSLKIANNRGSVSDYFSAGQEVTKNNLKKGDLIFFAPNGTEPTAVGIYADGGNFILASGSYGKVKVLNFSNHVANPDTEEEDPTRKTYEEIFFGARRVIGTNTPLIEVKNLKRGDTGSEIQTFQNDLNAAGYYSFRSGSFDDQTQSSVESLQTDYNLSVDGIATPRVQEIVAELKQARVARLLIP